LGVTALGDTLPSGNVLDCRERDVDDAGVEHDHELGNRHDRQHSAGVDA
jgi:hypothetical protein